MRALVLSGGGSRGQYHIGALRHLYREKKISHQIISGVSVGGLIGSYLAQYREGLESYALDQLAEVFTPLKTSDVHKGWPLGMLDGILRKKSFRDSSPLRKLVHKHIDTDKVVASGKKLRIGVTLLQPVAQEDNLVTNYQVYNEGSMYLKEAILASSALSPFLEPVMLADAMAIDGGVQAVTPIKAAIDAGAKVIDMVCCYPSSLIFTKKKGVTAVDLTMHVLDLLIQKLTWVDIDQTRYINKIVAASSTDKKKYVELNVIHPRSELLVNPLTFAMKDAQTLQAQGYQDAKTLMASV